jgi:hypothetical protein
VAGYMSEPVTKMVLNDAIVAVKTVDVTQELNSSNVSGRGNPWGDYVSKEHFVDMHFC